MSITPTVLIAGSGLLNNQSMSIDNNYSSDITALSENASANIFYLLYLYRNITWNRLSSANQATILELIKDHPLLLAPAGADNSVFSIAGEVRTAQSNFTSTATNFSRRVNYVLQAFTPLVYSADGIYSGLNYFENLSWEDLSLDIKDHSDLASNGILRVLLTGSDDRIDNIAIVRQQLRTGETLNDLVGRRLAVLSSALRNLGRLFDPNDLANMGKAKTLIENLYSLGLSRLGGLNKLVLDLEIDDLDAIKDQYLKELLTKVTGRALTEIIEQTDVVLPDVKQIKTAADLLDENKLFSSRVIKELPKGTLSGLAAVLDKVGGQYQTLAEVADMLDAVEVPDLSLLTDQVQPVPADVQTDAIARLGSGTGLYGNPTIKDFFWWLSGQGGYKKIADTFRQLREACLADSAIVLAMGRFAAHYSPAVSPSLNYIYLKALFDAMLANTSVRYWLVQCDKVYPELVNQYAITKSLYSLHTGGTFATFAATGTEDENDVGISVLVNNLHSYGVDSMGLGFRDFFLGLANSSRYGEALKTAIQEGRTYKTQVERGIIPVGRVDTDKQRKLMAGQQLDLAIADLKVKHADYEAVMKRDQVNPAVKAHIIDERQTAIEKVKQLAIVANRRVNPYREIY